MSLELFSGVEIYEDFRRKLSIPTVGFRGQPYQFGQSFLKCGFDIERPYYAVDFSKLNWDKMRSVRPRLISCFEYSMGYGMTGSDQAPKITNVHDFTVDKVLAYYQKHPEDYTSLLVLQFSGQLRERFYREPYDSEESIVFQRKALPKEAIADVITLNSKDFEELRDVLNNRQLLDENEKQILRAHFLRRKMIRKYLQTIMGN